MRAAAAATVATQGCGEEHCCVPKQGLPRKHVTDGGVEGACSNYVSGNPFICGVKRGGQSNFVCAMIGFELD